MRDATRTVLPKGREAQCPICWRIFSSDSACEKHKPYRRPVSEACKEPPFLGFTAFERRGLAVWYPAGGSATVSARPRKEWGQSVTSSGDVMPAPTSTYQLRTHLRDDHGDDRRGAGWFDLVLLHDHAHDHHDPGHDHEQVVG